MMKLIMAFNSHFWLHSDLYLEHQTTIKQQNILIKKSATKIIYETISVVSDATSTERNMVCRNPPIIMATISTDTSENPDILPPK